MTESKNPLVSYLLLALLIIIWGVSWPIYKHGVNFMPPLLFAGIRSFIAGIMLLTLAWKMRHLLKCELPSTYASLRGGGFSGNPIS